VPPGFRGGPIFILFDRGTFYPEKNRNRDDQKLQESNNALGRQVVEPRRRTAWWTVIRRFYRKLEKAD